jgi:hypothetical protein
MLTHFRVHQTRLGRIIRLALAAMLVATILFTLGSTLPVAAGAQTDLPGPAGSNQFGANVAVLPNGNLVVTDPDYDASDSLTDVGAVYFYNGDTGALISTLTGSTPGDEVGVGGVTVLANGNFVVLSSYWHNGAAAAGAGAVTWVNGAAGLNGVVSIANSLVGSTAYDMVGLNDTVVALNNGNYVVDSSSWDNGDKTDAGAVTWGSGATGVIGAVSATNSLVGAAAFDQIGDIGDSGMIALSSGNYLVRSPHWNNEIGAVTWGNGATGIAGVVSAANSLVGSTAGDKVGGSNYFLKVLTNGNYVVASPDWNHGAGAVTWGSGATGVKGAVSAANSLVGASAGDYVGADWIATLSNGNYVVDNLNWNNGAGAATWGNGATGVVGTVSAANSLVGSTAGDQVGSELTALSNGNYVVMSDWHNATNVSVGAATWADGATGLVGTVSATNSLIGSTTYGPARVTALTNGNYVVESLYWNSDDLTGTGAATWENGTTGVTGEVSAANSLVGSIAYDSVDTYFYITALSNGHYVVSSPHWQNGDKADAGAVTWGNGATGTFGSISAANSLVGSRSGDRVGSGLVVALSNGNYVVNSMHWQNDASISVGAATWGNGATGITGTVSETNSLVGSTAYDAVGYWTIALSNGNYVVTSPHWDNGSATDAGAVTWGDGAKGVSGVVSATNSLVGSYPDDYVGCLDANCINYSLPPLGSSNYVVFSAKWRHNTGAITPGMTCAGFPTVGPITAANSVRGTAGNDSTGMNFAYDPVHQQLVVGRPLDNIVTLFALSCTTSTYAIFLPVINK